MFNRPKGKAAKRRKMTNNSGSRDRLSSLSDDILIEILSRIPLRLAIDTGCLSWRWYGLWRNLTTINITNPIPNYLPEFFTDLNDIVKQFTSPVICSFTVDFVVNDTLCSTLTSIDTLLCQICGRNNVLELNVRWSSYFKRSFAYTLPCAIFQTKSLVSLELGSSNFVQLPDDCELINLPNLKNLSIDFFRLNFKLLEKLIEACPSLDDLSIKCHNHKTSGDDSPNIRFSNQNLRRLSINLCFTESNNLVINATKLEYLAITAPRSLILYFDKEPIMLREAKLGTPNPNRTLSVVNAWFESNFYEMISDVRFLTLGIFMLQDISTVFRNVSLLTFDMRAFHNIEAVLSLLELCPVLDVLTLKCWGCGVIDGKLRFHPKPNQVGTGTLRIIPKQIKIDTHWYSYTTCFIPTESLLELVECLLCICVDLERFTFRIDDDNRYIDWTKCSSVEHKQMELELCKLLYKCPRVSTRCGFEFVGRFLKMSRDAGTEF